jgi:uncharacterized protein YgiM (DUF1202 family)
MKNIITLTTLIFLTFQVFGQDYKQVNTETLNVREGAGKEYNVVGQINMGEKVTTLSESDSWTQIETETGLTGFVATKYLSSETDEQPKKNDKKESSWFSILIVLGVIGYGLYRVKNFFSGLFSGSSSRSNSQRSTPPKKQEVRRKSSNNAVYRFRIKGNGSAGGFKYVDGMNVEVAVSGLGAGGSPFNNIVEKLFVQEIARKYNVEPRFHSGIKMLFKRDSVDVEIM